MLQIGDYVKRYCPDIIGHDSIGQIMAIHTASYEVNIVDGKNGMEDWYIDYWVHRWCRLLVDRTPDWEV